MSIAKFFNTAGPMRPNEQYCVSPLKRINLTEIMQLIEQKKYFLLHAPRQTGKTSCLLALMEHLNNTGQYKCLYVNIEPAQAARENVEQGIKAIVQLLASNAEQLLKDDTMRKLLDIAISGSYSPLAMLDYILSGWAEQSVLPIVLLLDEVDALVGDTLISLLRQLRGGYGKRPEHFPSSVLLCGVRDIRDYRIHSSAEKTVITGGSAFNVKAKSLRLGSFNKEEVSQLYYQHTESTGQIFTDGAIDLVFYLTSGQPWLVNAVAYEACFEIETGKNREQAITIDIINEAKENLIKRRDVHLDQLIDKLKEDRVRRIIAPLLSGEDSQIDRYPDDIEYACDLGLIVQTTNGEIKIANKIYQEVIPRELAWHIQPQLTGLTPPTAWYLDAVGKIDMPKLLGNFQQFFRENAEMWLERYDYKEAGPQIILQAFLQRIINGGGYIIREYGLGRRRTDLFIEWKYAGGVQKELLELKIQHKSRVQTLQQGLEQTADYMDKVGIKAAYLLIFNRDASVTWDEKIYCEEHEYVGKKILVYGL